MPDAEKWVLLPNCYDDSLVKNAFVYQYAREHTTIPAPRGQFVDLYLNESYVGNYFLCEKVEVDKNRLNITDLEERTKQVNYAQDYENVVPYISADGKIKAVMGLTNPEDITGGYLLEHIPASSYEAAESAFMTDSGHCYEIVSPAPATVEQAKYICGLFNEMETAIAQEDGINPDTGKHFSEYLDLDSWTSKYVIEEGVHDVDAGTHSMFFYKDSDEVDPLIYSGPMWDYDRAIGCSGVYYFQYEPECVGEYGIYVKELMQHESVREQLCSKLENQWIPYVKYMAGADMYELTESVRASLAMTRIRWPQAWTSYTDPAAIRDYMLDFLMKKSDRMKSVWAGGEEYCTVIFLDGSGVPCQTYYVKKGDYLTTVPEVASYTGIFSGWKTVDGGAALDLRRPILQDVTYRSEWIDAALLMENGLGAAEMDVSQVDAEALQVLVDQIKKAQAQNAECDPQESDF